MRIVAGTHRSRVLEAPKGDAIRPTADKVRGAIFNMLQSRGAVRDAIVMDVFCGTGALGLEALSQGAAHCIFVDKDKPALDLARRNTAALKEESRTRFIFSDAVKIPARPDDAEAATLVFLDPPYSKGLMGPALEALAKGGWLADDAYIVAEEAQDFIVPDGFTLLTEKTYGDTRVRLLSYASQPL